MPERTSRVQASERDLRSAVGAAEEDGQPHPEGNASRAGDAAALRNASTRPWKWISLSMAI